MKTSCYVLSAAFSGSTLLNALLDTQPRVRGIGEAIHLLYRGELGGASPWCNTCRQFADQCEQRPRPVGSNLHAAYFERYPDTDVLVDISKSWDLCFRRQSTQARIKIITLAKWPHAFAWSQYRHFQRLQRERTVRECFDAWALAYKSTQLMLDAHSGFTGRRRHALQLRDTYPQLQADDILTVAYHELVTDVVGTVRRICEFLNTPFDEAALADWHQQSDTCSIGGNRAVNAQRTNPDFFADQPQNPELTYLGGKYIGRHRQIFLDTSWLSDKDFIREAHQCYDMMLPDLRESILLFGLGSYQKCVQALRHP